MKEKLISIIKNRTFQIATFVLILIFSITTILVIGIKKFSDEKTIEPSGSELVKDEVLDEEGDCVSDIAPVFTSNFIDLSQVEKLGMIGSINAGSPTRSYIQVKEESGMVKVYAPADATLEYVIYSIRSGDPSDAAEYGVDLRVSCEVSYHFDHLDDVSERIKEYAPSEPTPSTARMDMISIKIEEGEYLGLSDGTMANTFDFFIFNKGKKAFHINPERWTWDQNLYGDCPYDYFTDDLRDLYYPYLAGPDGVHPDIPSCGSITHDVEGTLAGGWFQGNSTDLEGNRMIVGDNNSFVELFIDRDDEPRFGVRDYNFTKVPSEILLGEDICYDDGTKYVYLFLVSKGNLKTNTGDGDCPDIWTEEGFEEWER